MQIEIQNLSKQFKGFRALDDVSLDIASGSLVALLGPSGCGKTTLLRIIAGLESPDAGTVQFGGESVMQRSVRERRVGFVFQHYALFRHMSVFENVAFGLTVRPRRERPAPAEIRKRVMALLELVQLDWAADRRPHQLSGGQRQRIALARALAVEPRVLLLDEPFGALDAQVRRDLRRWLRRLHDELHVTSVFVTHDQEEALEVADRVVVMNAGRVEQEGTPDAVYDHPQTPFVYGFLGNVNQFAGQIANGRLREGEVELAVPEHAGTTAAATLYVRPQDFELTRTADAAPAFAGVLREVCAVGPVVRMALARPGDGAALIEVELPRERFAEGGWQRGETVYAAPRRMRVFATHDLSPVNGTEPPAASGVGAVRAPAKDTRLPSGLPPSR